MKKNLCFLKKTSIIIPPLTHYKGKFSLELYKLEIMGHNQLVVDALLVFLGGGGGIMVSIKFWIK